MDINCKCGHAAISHGNNVCWKCYENRDMYKRGDYERGIHNFTPDNLKYLEEKYNQRILDKYRNK